MSANRRVVGVCVHSDANVDRLQISQRGTYYVKMIIGNVIKLKCDVFARSHSKTEEVRHSHR